ncbi:MAG: hypothetical protein ABQ298_15295 [Puniceicoccaceae bacterium]
MQLDGTWIAIDASCPQLQVALLKNGTVTESIEVSAPAMEGMMSSIQQVCERQQHRISETNGFLYGSGPGSILGIRLSLMAIRTWATLHRIPSERILHFRSLAMACAQHRLTPDFSPNHPTLVCSEWKTNRWNVMIVHDPLAQSSIEVWSSDQLEAFDGKRLLLPQRKLWSQTPNFLQPIQYQLDLLSHADLRSELLHPSSPHWEIYTPDETRYARWSGERHRAT